jgi:hypothetical protein
MRSQGVKDALKPPNDLYTLALLGNEIEFELIGEAQVVLVSHQD